MPRRATAPSSNVSWRRPRRRIRERDAARRELQAAHEARDAAEVLEAARHPERDIERELDVETVVDLTAITEEEERQLAIEQRTRALELALRDAEMRAESAELELDRHRQFAGVKPAEPTPIAAVEHVPAPVTPDAPEQFRGPSRGARRFSFKADITVQIDGTPGKLVDLSMTGAQVLTPAAMKPNRLITVTLPLGDSSIGVQGQGHVVATRAALGPTVVPRRRALHERRSARARDVSQHAPDMRS